MNTPAPTTPRTNPRMAVAVSCIALFTDMLIYGILIPLLPLMPAVERAGSSATGLLFAAYAAMMIAVTPLAGRLVDRKGPRGPLLAALLGLAAACLLFAVGGPYWLLLISRLLQGAAAGLGWVASLALIAASIPLERRGTYLGLAMSMVSIGTLAGPPLAGWLARDHGHAAPFALAAAVLILDGVLRVVFVRPTPPSADDPATPLDVLRVGGSWPVVILIAVGSAVTSAIEPILPVRLAVGLGLDTAGIGLLFALLVIIGAVLNPMVGAILNRVSPRVLALIGAALAIAGLLLLGAGSRLPVVIAGIVCLGGAIAFLVAPAGTLIGVQGARTTPPALGGAYSLYNLAYAAGLTLGPVTAGALTSALGYSAACAVLAGAVAVVALGGFSRLPRSLSSSEV
ncbi:MFS transporter [Actinomyces massiliensis]|uniref:MFS transporter n=1 Tax=Actinomyces massiliensis TaxID=461393 RepID=UPI0002F323E3|nr:MFS transporter [Actinomyces massiliensis]